LAGKALVEHGHRRLAFITTEMSATAQAYSDGMREALQAGGVEVPLEVLYVAERPIQQREESCFAALQMTFSGPDRPTGIFASFDSLAEMIYMLLPRLGLRVPNDVSLIGEGGIWREGVITRRLTSVVVDEIATGRKAVDLLSEMRRGDRAIDDNTEIVLELGLSDGETLATPASAK
jgi:DNA-binding LacI/PurR family transcriptional regulator